MRPEEAMGRRSRCGPVEPWNCSRQAGRIPELTERARGQRDRERGMTMAKSQWVTRLLQRPVVMLLALVILALPAAAAVNDDFARENRGLANFSQSVALHYWLAHPSQAPSQLSRTLQHASALRGKGAAKRGSAAEAFNFDTFGLPQNEESITACRSNLNVVLGGTNDYRGLLDPEFNFTGWHLSSTGGRSLTNEGLLPSIDGIPSGGDPVDVADPACYLYAGSLNYNPFDPFNNPNGIGVYRTTPATLASCPGGSDPSCWPTRKLVAASAPSHFLDKEWLDVGVSGSARLVGWVVYSAFVID